MGNFGKNKRSFGGGSSRRDSSRGRGSGGGSYRDRDEKPRFKAVCDSCGKNCDVPFRPTGSKPVYCDNCFGKQDGNDNFRGSSDSNYDRSEREMFAAVCDNCGKNCEVPFKPSSNKPIYCSRCFEDVESGQNRRNNGGSDSEIKEQLSEINKKLSQILKALDL